MTSDPSEDVVIVAIGRNEGERLKSCLRTLMRRARLVVYVDSGSVDGSPQYAASVGCHVVELDPSRPFSAARARNEGFAYVVEHSPNIPFIQFLDGDCDLVEGWLQCGMDALTQRVDVGIVCGHVRELYPEASIYNKLFDLEWQLAPGEIRSSGGRFLIRTGIFQAVGGFRPDVIAAEDDEFCIRVRGLGWKILQVDADMARHDMAMTRFTEWWRRSVRTGHAFAQVAALHSHSEERYFRPEIRRVFIWALALPLLAVCLAPFTHGLSLLVLVCLYGLQFARVYVRCRRLGWANNEALIYSTFTAISKFPALLGIFEYHWRRWRGDSLKIIEYRRST
jgi:GT2 family glycosyltransferase